MMLLTPGPVTTRPEVRAALAQDIAPWDNDFKAVYRRVRDRVRNAAGGVAGVHEALPLQGSGHFAIEAAIRTFIPAGGRILIPATGRYSESMIRLARDSGREPIVLPIDPNRPCDPRIVEAVLEADERISHVGIVYSETGTGVIHDAIAIGDVARRLGRRTIVDAVSAFGALPFDISVQTECDAIVFTANKCIEALPGIAFAVCPIEQLKMNAKNAGSWSLDLADVLANGDRPRYTPPAQIVAAFDKALDYFEEEGGQPARLARYTANAAAFYDGMVALGLTPWLAKADQGPIIVVIKAPDDPRWNLQAFVDFLKARDIVISNFFNTPTPSFRVGCIGAIGPEDMRRAVAEMDAALRHLGVEKRAAA